MLTRRMAAVTSCAQLPSEKLIESYMLCSQRRWERADTIIII